MPYQLNMVDGDYAICRLPADAALPNWARGEFVSLTRTSEELTVICQHQFVPANVKCESNWTCLKLMGPFELTEIGVLAALSAPLARANISIFVVGTFDTDYLLVRSHQLADAVAALVEEGHEVTRSG